ncbi:hypothetical protein BJ912DRAFT_800640, partial [Pholiota molesta]
MPYRSISRNVKVAAIRLYERHILSLYDILDCCRMSKRTFYRILKLWRTTGDVVRPQTTLQGRNRKLDYDDICHLLELVRQNPDYFLDELLCLLETNRFISLHYVTIHRELERAGMSRKKLKVIAMERNEDRRADFIGRMAQYAPEEIGFLDELSKDARSGLLTLDGMVSGTVVKGSFTKKTFFAFMESVVV